MSPAALNLDLEQLVEPICRSCGVELVDVRLLHERGGKIVRVLIDRDRGDGVAGSGVDLEDCTAVSRALSARLDEEPEAIPGTFHLEVSSPGLERPLVRLHDFERFVGREAKIKTQFPIDERRSFDGCLLGVEGTTVKIEVDGRTHAIPFDVITKANLVHRF